MRLTLAPGLLQGTVAVPSSKSHLHRLLIASALCKTPTRIQLRGIGQDVRATLDCLSRLGVIISETSDGLLVQPRPTRGQTLSRSLHCCESGSTLRFLLPVAAALGIECTFTGSGRLPVRPIEPLKRALAQHGVRVEGDSLPFRISGRLQGGIYALPGNISSQFITGLLFALPLCPEDSELHLSTSLVSGAYVRMTESVLQQYGIRVHRTETGWIIPGGQCYAGPGAVSAEGDWSAGAVWHAANYLGSRVHCTGLNPHSIQADQAILSLKKRLGSTLCAADTPDLVPLIAIIACGYHGVTTITDAARLRSKESDRLRASADLVLSLGGFAKETDDGLVVHGKALDGGLVDCYGDHRIVMAAAIAATAARGNVTLLDVEAVSKSYPNFFEDFIALGGVVRV